MLLRKSPRYKAKIQRQWNYKGKLKAIKEWVKQSNIQLMWALDRENRVNTNIIHETKNFQSWRTWVFKIKRKRPTSKHIVINKEIIKDSKGQIK